MTIVDEHHAEIRAAAHWHKTAPEIIMIACAGTCAEGKTERTITEHKRSRWQVGYYRCGTCGAKQQQPWRMMAPSRRAIE
jgi:hypothetical protein